MPCAVLSKASVGFFGKLPSTGDFVARGLQQGVKPILDQWLTRGLAARHDTPDAWPKDGIRAVLKWNNLWLVLLILPSVDKPERKFPFTICRISSVAPNRQSADGWCNSVLGLAREAVAKPMLAQDVMRALAEIKETELEPNPETAGDAVWSPETKLIPLSDCGLTQALDGLFQATS